MIDWLEEILKAAEPQDETEEEDLPAGRFLPVGTGIRPVGGGGEREAADAAEKDGELSLNGRSAEIRWAEISEGGTVSRLRAAAETAAIGRGTEAAAASVRAEMASAAERETASKSAGTVGFESIELPTPPTPEGALTDGNAPAAALLHSVMEQTAAIQAGVLGRLIWRAGARQADSIGSETARSGVDLSLPVLYRRAGEAVRSMAVSAGQPGMTVVQEVSSASAGLSAAELDRAVRRDSRRYDGGMSIY